MFITTANTLSGILVPLQDRMEIIQLSGYTEFEKMNIAVKYLVPRQTKVRLEDVLFTLERERHPHRHRQYTREAGVRSLEREISSICRKVAQGRERGQEKPIDVVANGPDIPSRVQLETRRRSATRSANERPIGGHELRAAVSCSRARSRSWPGNSRSPGLLEKGMEESARPR